MYLRAKDLTEKEKDQIVKIYLEEKSIKGTSDRLKIGYKLTKNVLIERDVIIKKRNNTRHKKDFSDLEIHQLESDYENGYSVSSLKKKYQTSADVINGIIGASKERMKKPKEFSSVNEVLKYCAESASEVHKKIIDIFPVSKIQ